MNFLFNYRDSFMNWGNNWSKKHWNRRWFEKGSSLFFSKWLERKFFFSVSTKIQSNEILRSIKTHLTTTYPFHRLYWSIKITKIKVFLKFICVDLFVFFFPAEPNPLQTFSEIIFKYSLKCFLKPHLILHKIQFGSVLGDV